MAHEKWIEWNIAPMQGIGISSTLNGEYGEVYFEELDDLIEQCRCDNGYMIIGCDTDISQEQAIDVPDVIDGKRILAVACDALVPYGGVNDVCERVTFGNGIRLLGAHLLVRFNALKSISLPKSLQYIGESSLASRLEYIKFPSQIQCIEPRCCADNYKLRDCLLPSGIPYIGTEMFSACTNLRNIWLPNTVHTINQYAFAYSGLESIVLLEGLTTIESGAFCRCDRLMRVILPKSLTKIADDAFDPPRESLLLRVLYGSEAHAWAFMHGYNIEVLRY